jgi:hypothetical protein
MFADTLLRLPMYFDLENEQIKQICDVIISQVK